MKPLQRGDLLDLTRYEQARAETLARVIALKRPRRISVGPSLTFLFENRDTVWFQVQEMVRAERIVDEEKLRFELAVYNPLIPGDDELSATLMIEITEREQIREELDRLIGIDEHVFLDVGDTSVRATFDPKQFEEERIAAVQYVRFRLGRELAARFADPAVPVRLRVEHPAYREATPLSPESRAALAADLAA